MSKMILLSVILQFLVISFSNVLSEGSTCTIPDMLTPEFLIITDMMGKSTFDLGKYDGCQNSTGNQYCLMNSDSIYFGLCLPQNCSMPQDVTNSSTGVLSFLLSQIPALLFLDPEDATYHCGDNSVPFSSGSYFVFAIILFVFVMTTLGTLVDVMPSIRLFLFGRKTISDDIMEDSSNQSYSYNMHSSDVRGRNNLRDRIQGVSSSSRKTEFNYFVNDQDDVILQGDLSWTNIPLVERPTTWKTSMTRGQSPASSAHSNTGQVKVGQVPRVFNVGGLPLPDSSPSQQNQIYLRNLPDNGVSTPLHYPGGLQELPGFSGSDEKLIYEGPVGAVSASGAVDLAPEDIPNACYRFFCCISVSDDFSPRGRRLRALRAAARANRPRACFPNGWSDVKQAVTELLLCFSFKSSWHGLLYTRMRARDSSLPQRSLSSPNAPSSATTVSLSAPIRGAVVPNSAGSVASGHSGSLGTGTQLVPQTAIRSLSTGKDGPGTPVRAGTPTPTLSIGANRTGGPGLVSPGVGASSPTLGMGAGASMANGGVYNQFTGYYMNNKQTPAVPPRNMSPRVAVNSEEILHPNGSPRPSSKVVTIADQSSLSSGHGYVGNGSTTTGASSIENGKPHSNSVNSNSTAFNANANAPAPVEFTAQHHETNALNLSPLHSPYLDGVRAVSTLIILLGTTVQFMITPGVTNAGALLPPHGLFTRVSFQIFPSASFATDALLVLSGLLGFAGLLAEAEYTFAETHGLSDSLPAETIIPTLKGPLASLGRHNNAARIQGLSLLTILRFVFGRLARLLPLYTFVLLVYIFVIPSFSDGPFWWALEPLTAACRSRWWTNLLFVNNLVPWRGGLDTDGTGACMPWTWQLGVDVQLYLLIPFILLIYVRSRVSGFVVMGALFIAAIIASEEVLSLSNLSPLIDLGVSTLQPAPSSTQMLYYDDFFVKPWTRAPAFLLGCLLAACIDSVGAARARHMAILKVWKRSEATMNLVAGSDAFADLLLEGRFSRKVPYTMTRISQMTLAGIASAVALICVYAPASAYKAIPSPWSASSQITFGILSRPAFALSVALHLFLALTQSGGGLVGWILSWRVWRPLARLSFAFCLVLPIVVQMSYYSKTQLFRISWMSLVEQVLVNGTAAAALAFYVYVTVEAPAVRLQRWMMHRLLPALIRIERSITISFRNMCYSVGFGDRSQGRSIGSGDEGDGFHSGSFSTIQTALLEDIRHGSGK